ncbi:hypothetical protein DPMN_165024 [Dreissena polymorpha]|uniref:Uncharacterized protein n=1 Tax=Dreissena polymorpha TaxID=45954 RepID=A0A9D4EU00_DREPO|nr:hypothetical protein DPMN_165024 [Dreissena polymorpha]
MSVSIKKTDEENHFRETLLLFYPWKDEDKDLLGKCDTFKSHYLSMQRIIDAKCKEYEQFAELELARDVVEADSRGFDDIAPSTEQMEGDTAEEEAIDSESFIYCNHDRVF